MYTAKNLPQQPGSVAIDPFLLPLADFLEFPGTVAPNPQGPAASLGALDGEFFYDDLFDFSPPNGENGGPILTFGDVRGIVQAGSLDATGSVSYSAVTDLLSYSGASPALPSAWEWSVQSSVDLDAASEPILAAPGAAWSGESYGVGEITMLAGTSAAKGGNPGKPDKSGGGGGGSDGGGDGVLSKYFSGSGDGDAGYDIWLDFKGSGWTTTLQDAFINAADYFTTVITADIGGGGRYRGKTIDDLYVSAELKDIDGEGGILGQAGPTAVWTANDLTAVGMMQFDVADASNYSSELWGDIVMHEFMHVLGFGSLWNYGVHAENKLVVDGRYEGAYALTAYQIEFVGEEFIPVEQDGGPGTAGAHWDEETLNNELMTGYINESNYLSEFSVMALADLGYTVDYVDFLIV